MAKALFGLYIKNYPDRSNVYDSMGDCYLVRVNTLQAVKQFEKAHGLADNSFTRKKPSQQEKE